MRERRHDEGGRGGEEGEARKAMKKKESREEEGYEAQGGRRRGEHGRQKEEECVKTNLMLISDTRM